MSAWPSRSCFVCRGPGVSAHGPLFRCLESSKIRTARLKFRFKWVLNRALTAGSLAGLLHPKTEAWVAGLVSRHFPLPWPASGRHDQLAVTASLISEARLRPPRQGPLSLRYLVPARGDPPVRRRVCLDQSKNDFFSQFETRGNINRAAPAKPKQRLCLGR